ncbi:MAG: VWA domain-containing protein [Alphaproteobacteria bacterium]|nr:VWA domain-containing protein [Alphaproteobacteria bacterium]MCB9929789.1 VWA domain-containing protein [Alphaproteobacteria bacterium]
MERTFTNFLKALRGADVPVSVADTLDAMEVAKLVGWEDRQMLKTSLSFALAKSEEEKEAFSDTFDDFFRADSFRNREDDEGKSRDRSAMAGDADSALAQMLMEDDQTGLALSMEQAAAAIGVENIRFFTQRGLYVQRIMNEMGLQDLDAQISQLGREGGGGMPGSGGEGQGGGGQGMRQQLQEGRSYLFEQVRDFVEQQLQLHGQATSKQLKEDRLRRSRLGNLDKRDQEEMRKIVDKIAKRLVALYARKRKIKDRGHLDVRQTMRKNYANDGILFHLEWKMRKLDKPKVIVICDVSGSVAAVARFLLQFLYALHEVLSGVRSFAFSGKLIETSDFFERHLVDEAVDKVMNAVGYMSTDYGQSLSDFREGWLDQVDKRTTILILGDARSNYSDPRADIMKELYERSKRVIFLNPEPPPLWGTGDSETRRYRPYCHVMKECSTLNHLERLVEDLLESANKLA